MHTVRGRRILRFVRGAFIAGIVSLLIYQLSGIGWKEVWNALPTQPLYYVILLAMYLLLPVTESLIYGRLWHIRARDCLPIMIRKRVLNMDLVGYSGEIYFFVWAKDRIARSRGAIMATIKDNLILSSAASIAAAVLLLVGLVVAGQLDVNQIVDNPSPIYAGVGVIAASLIGMLVYRFRRAIFSLPTPVLAAVGATHLSRFFAGYALMVAQWWVVVPSASFEAWAILLTASVLINRIPFLPSSDLVFVSAGAGLAPYLDVPAATVVGMLLVRSAVDRVLNLLLFTTTVWRERHLVSSESEEVEIENGVIQGKEAEPEVEVPLSLNS